MIQLHEHHNASINLRDGSAEVTDIVLDQLTNSSDVRFVMRTCQRIVYSLAERYNHSWDLKFTLFSSVSG